MASKLRFSLAACLLPVVLGAASLAQADDASPATQPSCNSGLLFPNDEEAGDGFGGSVAVNGQTAMVAIPFFSTAFVTPPVNPPYVSGRVAVFTCDASTQAWTRTATIQLPATDANQHVEFAFSVALQGNLAAVGTQGQGVYVYKRQGLNWNQIARLVPKNSDVGIIGTPAEQWGNVIALDDHVLAVGGVEIISSPGPGGIGFVTSGSYFVDVYQIVTLGDHGAAIRVARLRPPAGDTGGFGGSLALDRDTLVVGDPPDVTAYIYKRRGVTFRLEQTITGAEATTDSAFGTTVAIAKGVILVGAPTEDAVFDSFGVYSQGAVYAFRHKSGPGSPWVETQHFSPAQVGASQYAYFGGTLALNRNGLAAIGTPGAYDYASQTEHGPTFFYTLHGGQFVLSVQHPPQFGTVIPATGLGITDEYLISGSLFYEHGFQISSAEITNLTQSPAN